MATDAAASDETERIMAGLTSTHACLSPTTESAKAPSSPDPVSSPSASNNNDNKRSSFEWHRVLGYGACSRVVLAEHKQSGQLFAVKVVSKMQFISEKSLHVNWRNERDILKQCNHPNIIKLVKTFQTPDELFYVMEYAQGGELLDYIKKVGKFSHFILRHVAAEIINALEYLHARGIVHRDLKPENILLDASNHVKLVDFGTAFCQGQKRDPATIPQPSASISSKDTSGSAKDERGQTFCGTFQYISPELLDQGITTMASDLWAVGCIIYQMAAGHRPFDNGSVMQIFEKIRNPEEHLSFPPDFPDDVRDLVGRLLVKDPNRRLGTEGMGGYPVLKSHPLFKGIDFNTLPEKELKYDWKPAAPVWVSDENAYDCKRCHSVFTFTNRRHHCRKCGEIFCKSCSGRTAAIPGLYQGKVRVCDDCFTILRRASQSDALESLRSSFQSNGPLN